LRPDIRKFPDFSLFDTVADLKQAALKIEKLDEETTYTDEIPVEDQASAARLVLKQAHAS
jgi:hypothetical protein